MGRKVNYFEAKRQYTTTADTALSVVVSAAVPAFLSAIETRKGFSFWETPQDFSDAYQALTRQQWELLMDATETIMRGLFYVMGYPRDVVLAADGFPAVELPEATLFDIRKHIADPADGTLYSRLAAIESALVTEGVDGETVAALMARIAPIIAGAI